MTARHDAGGRRTPKASAASNAYPLSKASASIATTLARIESFWIDGADLPPTATETAIDAAALAGDCISLREALAAYEGIAWAACIAAEGHQA